MIMMQRCNGSSLPLESGDEDVRLALVVGGLRAADVARRLVEGVVLGPRLLVLLLALHPELLRHAESLQQGTLLLLEVSDHALLSFPFPQLVLQFLLFELFELVEFVQEVQLPLFVGVDMLQAHFVCLLRVLFPHVFALHLG